MRETRANEHGRVDRVAEAILLLRQGLGLTQAQFGSKVLVHKNSIYRYEKGSLRPSIHVLLLLWKLAETRIERPVFAAALAEGGIDPDKAISGSKSARSSRGDKAAMALHDTSIQRSVENGNV